MKKIGYLILAINILSCSGAGGGVARTSSLDTSYVPKRVERVIEERKKEERKIEEKKEKKEKKEKNEVHFFEIEGKDNKNIRLIVSQLNDKLRKNFSNYDYLNETHAKLVLDSFLSHGKNGINNDDIQFHHSEGEYNGIINISHGIRRGSNLYLGDYLNPESEHNPKSLLSQHKPYISVKSSENNQLRIKSLGNSGENHWTSAYLQAIYQVLDSETQKEVRNNIIYVGNKSRKDINTNYKAMLLRSFVVFENGNISGKTGSSFSAPRVTRLAYEIKKRYPFLRYNQIKQVILTTAKNKGSLDNKYGWGDVDFEKALKGPGAFNLGLVEEEKYYNSTKDKIKDEYGNYYMYVNIPSGTYTWSNDIEGGLEDKNKVDEYVKVGEYNYRIPGILNSEHNYYNPANFRKDGKGTLILTGKQNYTSKTQILDGVLNLQNDSKSKYEILNGSKLLIDKKDVNISNDVLNDKSVLEVRKKLKVNNYYASANSKTIISDDIQTNSYVQKGELVVQNDGKQDLPKIMGNQKLEMDENSLKNTFLRVEKVSDNVYQIKDKKVRLKDLSNEELKDIPSYNMNTKKFFDEYKDTKVLRNVIKETEACALERIFTDNYSSFISENIDIQNEIINNNISEYENVGPNSVFFNTYNSFNLNDGKKYTMFNRRVSGASIGIKKKVVKDFNMGLSLGMYNSNYNFFEKNKNNIQNDTISVNLTGNYTYKNIHLLSNLGYSKSMNKATRYINDGSVEINSRFNTDTFNLDLKAGYVLGLTENLSIIPSLALRYMNTSVGDVKESTTDTLMQGILLELRDNTINSWYLNPSLDLVYNNNRLTFINRIGYIRNLSKNIQLNARMANTDFKLVGKNPNKNIFEYKGMIRYMMNNNFTLASSLSINSASKIGTSITLSYTF